MRLTLKRIASRPDGTFGVLLAEDVPFALTLERPWRDNRRGESCIPTGRYLCTRVNSPKFGMTWHVRNVPDRSEILFHAGNTFTDSHGCILVAERFATWADGTTSIADSRVGMAELMALTRDLVSIDLEIRQCL
jgi:hypothetical protein